MHAPDRLARRYAYQVLLIEEFCRAGVEIVSLNRPIGGSAEDDLLLQIQGVIAEYERARILERSRRGRRHAARSGAVSAMCGAPFGYRYVDRHACGGAAQFEVIEHEAQMVRQVFTWIGIERISLREACRRLQGMDRVTRTGLECWDATTLNGMLRNPAYRGAAMFGRTRSIPPAGVRLRLIRGRTQPPRDGHGSHAAVPCDKWISIPVPAILDPDIFETVQGQLDENRKRDGRRGRVGCCKAWSSGASVATRSMAKWPAARSAEVSQPTTSIIAALGRTLISSVASRFAAIARCAPTSWKQPYGIRSRPCWTTPSVWHGNTSGGSQRPGTQGRRKTRRPGSADWPAASWN